MVRISDERRTRKGGEAEREVLAGLLLLLLRGDAVVRIGVEFGPDAVRARLEAAAVEVGPGGWVTNYVYVNGGVVTHFAAGGLAERRAQTRKGR